MTKKQTDRTKNAKSGADAGYQAGPPPKTNGTEEGRDEREEGIGAERRGETREERGEAEGGKRKAEGGKRSTDH